MANKDFKVKNKLIVNGLTNASGPLIAESNSVDAYTSIPTQYGGTGTTTSPSSGQIPYSSSGTSYSPTDLSSLTVSLNGGSTITAASASTNPLIIKGAASQTANLQEWQDSSGTVLAKVNAAGLLTSIGITTTGAQTQINGAYFYTNNNISFSNSLQVPYLENRYYATIGGYAGTTAVPLTVKGVASQSANLQEWQNSSGTVLTYIRNDGLIGTSAGINATGNYTNSFGGTAISNVILAIKPLASNIGLAVRGASSQTANLQEWQDSSGTVYAFINPYGQLSIGQSPTIYSNARISLNTVATSVVGMVIRGVASQSANLQEWQNSSGTVLARVQSDGAFVSDYITAGQYLTSLNKLRTGGATSYGAQLEVTSTSATNIGAVIRGATSQSANLQEWQNSSGTALASVSSSGSITAVDLTLSGNLTVNGTTTNINTTNLVIEDKNIVIADVSSPTDTTADGAGITIKGASDKTFNWVQSTGAFTSSEPISAPGISVTGNSVSSNITLVAGKRYFVDTTATRTLTLPASPSVGNEIQIFDASNSAGTNNITVDSNGNKLSGSIQNLIIDSNAASVFLVYTGSTYGWMVA